ncbi:Gfo/Idh/MocA family protein [Umezawaea endophytica]|uniref:Gfo/Idh/MocA family oxidoreductase n=1 Tax=Umezawaea endophytica TaxID=1654476 RepID=A0A9X3AF27_9PSEU|nr:Gfo/Idh/MocA family oxidoreductase [Umezawaea endophytica]MCS7477706.1 Gfo/Idh/MocA family oxidoreductase [Umezawaea endophytica]
MTPMHDSPLRLAIAGAAHPHVSYALDELAHRDDVLLVGVSDPDPTLVAASHTDHRALLAERRPDVVVVAGVYADRAEVVVDALRSGAHVLADKPLCTTLSDLDLIEETAAETGRVVSLMLEKRFYPETLAARALLDSGELGSLVLVAASSPHRLNRATRPAWFLRRETYGGVIGDLAVHDVDLVLALSGATEGTVTAIGDRNAEFPLHGAVLLRAGDVAATIETSWLTPAASPWHGDYRMRLTGTEGTAELLWARGELTATTNDRPLWTVPLPEGGRPAADALVAFATGRVPRVGTAESVTATRIALLAQDSADNGGVVHRWTGGPR